jgi:hypothetical protein
MLTVMAKVKKTVKQANTTDGGIVVDLSQIDKTLTDRAKRFIFWFTFPGTDCFQHKTRAAIRAGYAKKNATSSGYKLCRNPAVQKEIGRLSGTFVSEQIDTLFNRYVESLEQRAFYDVADFYEGDRLKNLSEIEPGKRIALDGIDYKGNKGDRKVFMFGDRKDALRAIKDLHTQAHPTGGNPFDVEETKEIIMERVTIRQQQRVAMAADFEGIRREIVDPAVTVEDDIAEEL